MNVLFDRVWQGHIDHEWEILDIDSTSSHICTDQDSYRSIFEGLNDDDGDDDDDGDNDDDGDDDDRNQRKEGIHLRQIYEKPYHAFQQEHNNYMLLPFPVDYEH